MLRVRVLRAEEQLHVQVQGQVQVQVHANVQGSAWQQQCARAMCSGKQAVARSDPFVSLRVVYLGTRLGTSHRIADRRVCDHQLMGLPMARGEKNCCLFDGSRHGFARRVCDLDSCCQFSFKYMPMQR